MPFDAPLARARGERLKISFAVDILVALNLHLSAIRVDRVTGRGVTRIDVTGRGVTRIDVTGRGVTGRGVTGRGVTAGVRRIRVTRGAILDHISRAPIGPKGVIPSIRSQGIVRDDIHRGLRTVLNHERIRAHRGAVAWDHLVEPALRCLARGASSQGRGDPAHERAREACL